MLAGIETNNLDDALGLDLPKLFFTLESKACCKESAQNLPEELVSFVPACEIDLV